MPVTIETQIEIEVGQCIYCGANEDLDTEHIFPEGLSGRLLLTHASCKCCARMTSKIENAVLGSMKAARMALKTKTRHKSRRSPQPMYVEKNGEVSALEVMLQDQWKVIRLPIFPLPVALKERPYESGIDFLSMDEFQLAEKMEDIAANYGVDKVLFYDYPWEKFARFIAKVAYGYAVAWYSVKAFEKVYVIPAILGETNDIGRWVGCPEMRSMPVVQCCVSAQAGATPQRDLVVRLKMFPMFNGAEYYVVVGRMKEIYAVSYESRIAQFYL